MGFLERIFLLAGVEFPTNPPNHEDWAALELDLKVGLPSSLKDLISGLGLGYFGSGLFLLNPLGRSENTKLDRSSLIRYRDVVKFMTDEMNVSLFPEADGLILFSRIDRQHFFVGSGYSSNVKQSQLVWLDFDLEETHEFGMSPAEFIVKLYDGEIDGNEAHGLRRLIWRDQSVRFFNPAH